MATSGSARILAIVGAIVLLWPLGSAVIGTWTAGSRHSGGSLFAALATAAVLVVQARAIIAGRAEASRAAVFGLAAATLLYVYAMRVDVWALAGVAAIGVAASLLRIAHGRAGLRAAWPAIGMAVFIVPPPASLVGVMQTRFSLWIAEILATVMSWLLDEGVVASGTEVRFATTTVPIVDECSGMGGILIAAPFAMTMALLLRLPVGWRMALLLVTAPLLAAAANLLRVLVMGLMVGVGRADLVATPWIHELLGAIPLVAAGLSIWALAKVLRPRRSR